MDIVKAFRPFKGMLWLGQVAQLADDVALELAQRTTCTQRTLPHWQNEPAYLDGVEEYQHGPGHMALARALVDWNKNTWLGLRGLKRAAPEILQVFAEFNGDRLLANPEILKELMRLKKNLANEKIQKGFCKEPDEWQKGRIVPTKLPAKPLKGRNSKSVNASEVSWWLPQKVRDWFLQNLDNAHKTSFRLSEMGGKGDSRKAFISPEAAELLRTKSVEWMWLMEKELEDVKKTEKQKVQSLGNLDVPKEFRKDKVVLPAPSKPVAKAHCWKADFEGEQHQSVLHYYSYLPAEHVGSITDPKGYPAKAMSPEAADLYRRHRSFWEAKHAEAKAQMRDQADNRKKVGKERVESAAKSAGFTKEELNAKLDRLTALASKDNLILANEMIANFDKAWLFEALLAGAELEKGGKLKPGKELKRFKGNAEILMVMCLAHLPLGAVVDESLDRDAEMAIDVNIRYMDLLVGLAMHLPKLRPANINFGWEHKITKLSLEAAAFLARFKGQLDLHFLETLSDEAASALSEHEGNLELYGLKNLSDAAAEALAKHKGRLALSGLKSLSDVSARALAKHEGDIDLGGLKTLSDVAAEALSEHKGYLDLTGLKSLSDATAQVLAKHKGDLNLSGLKTLSASAATGLAKLKSGLYLGYGRWPNTWDGLNSLSDAVIQALSEHEGYLDLGGLKTLSEAAAQSLGKHKGHITLHSLEQLSSEGASHLVNLPSLVIRRSCLGSAAKKIFDNAGLWKGSTWTRGLK